MISKAAHETILKMRKRSPPKQEATSSHFMELAAISYLKAEDTPSPLDEWIRGDAYSLLEAAEAIAAFEKQSDK